MIKVNGNVITAETKTQKVVFVDGRITEIISKIDGQRYLNDNRYSEREAPLRFIYAFNRTYSLGKNSAVRIEIHQYSDTLVNISFFGWHGHGDILIEEGKDLCTLVTCTPYGVNTHRLLVCGSRIPYEEAEVILEETSQEEQPQSSWMKKYIEGIIWGIVVAIGLILLIVSAVQIYRKFTNNYGGGTYAEK